MTEITPLERAAKAAYEHLISDDLDYYEQWKNIRPDYRKALIEDFRFGLETLMEPTREMSSAAGDGAVAEFADDAWRAMLGKVLEG